MPKGFPGKSPEVPSDLSDRPPGAPLRVESKGESNPFYLRGCWGNKLRTWGSYDELCASGFSGLVTMRYRGAAGGGWCAYRVSVDDVPRVTGEWAVQGARPELIMFNEEAPDHLLVLQGEVRGTPTVIETPQGPGPAWFSLRYSCAPGVKLRDAMKCSREAFNLEARMLLRRHLSPPSLEDIDGLLDMFSEHVVEFSAYGCFLGDVPGRNTVIWEVRKY